MEQAAGSHGVPALASFFIPGLGQLFKGHVFKALMTWVALFLMTVAGALLFVPFFLLPVIWLWGVYDAYTSNHKEFSPPADR